MFPERIAGDTNKKTLEPRVVFIKKSQLELGVHLCGGNLHGVFVAEVEDDSPAKGPDGLVPGDLILEVSSELLSRSGLHLPAPGGLLPSQVAPKTEEYSLSSGEPVRADFCCC